MPDATSMLDPRIFQIHSKEFAKNTIPHDEPSPGERRVAIVAPGEQGIPEELGQILRSLSSHDTSFITLGQRHGNDPYRVRFWRSIYDVRLRPKGSILPDGEAPLTTPVKDEELLPWISAMAEEALAASTIFGAQMVIGVGAAGGAIAAEIAERMGIGMLMLVDSVKGPLSEASVTATEASVVSALNESWALASAERAANGVLLGADVFSAPKEHLSEKERLGFQLTKDTLSALIHSLEFDGPFTGRGFHRATQVWRGDIPKIGPGHMKAARQLAEKVPKWINLAKMNDERLIVAFGGESGSGKTEIASALSLILKTRGIDTALIPGDAFFRLSPSENHARRLELYAQSEGALADYLMSDTEIDYARLEGVLEQAKDMSIDTVLVPSDARRIEVLEGADGSLVRSSRRYEEAPVGLEGVDAAFVDLTTSPGLRTPQVRVINDHTFEQKLRHIEERNRGRDPDQDFDFIKTCLRLEHENIRPARERANVAFNLNYDMRIAGRIFSLPGTVGGGGKTCSVTCVPRFMTGGAGAFMPRLPI